MSLDASASQDLPPNVTSSTLRTNYSAYLLCALRLLRRQNPTSFYSFHVLSTMKHLGPISYALGASTSLYNEILFLKWTQFADLHGMADLMQEMINQGLEANEVTMVLVRKLNEKRKYAQDGKYGPVVKAWWNMRGNKEGWTKVWSLYDAIQTEDRMKSEEALSIDEDANEGEAESEA